MATERGITLDLEPEPEPTTDDDVFYNTAMVTNRDVSTACLAAHLDEDADATVVDALAASGIRGLRYLQEVAGVGRVILNDIDADAVAQIRANVAANDTGDRTEVTEGDAAHLLTGRYRGVDVVDIDPFGSPAPYLDAAARAVQHGGGIGATATDLGPLYGSYPEVCRRRYAASSMKNAFGHETGIRILIKEVFQACSRYDHAFEPLLCHHERHYSRVYGRVHESKQQCNRRMDDIGMLDWCRDCDWRGYRDIDAAASCPHCDGRVQRAGPLWTGPLADRRFAATVADELNARGHADAQTLAATVRDECEITTPFYDTHALAAAAGTPAPAQDALVAAIQEQGYRATRTHFLGRGVRTDAPIDTLHEALMALTG